LFTGTRRLMSALLSRFAFAFVLVLCRCGAAVMLLPGLGEEDPPAVLRVGLALSIAVLLTPVEATHMPAMPEGTVPLAGMVAAELLVGGVLGWLARLLALALPVAGQIIALMIGLSSVLVPDSVLGAQAAPIGKLFGIVSPVVILSTGLYALPLSALGGSYALFPPGVLLPAGDLADVALRAVTGSFALALRLASPFILVSIVWQVAQGLLSRLVPQLQIYFAALPAQVLGGLLLLALLARSMLHAWSLSVREGFLALPGA
jgi:flagellar biosynthetic protein FliR